MRIDSVVAKGRNLNIYIKLSLGLESITQL